MAQQVVAVAVGATLGATRAVQEAEAAKTAEQQATQEGHFLTSVLAAREATLHYHQILTGTTAHLAHMRQVETVHPQGAAHYGAVFTNLTALQLHMDKAQEVVEEA